MSTPYSGGNDPRDNHPENFGEGTYGTPDTNSTGYNDYYGYNGYGSSTGYNPYDVNAGIAGEDATKFHGTTLVDGTYGDGTQPHPVNDPAANGFTHLKGTGKMDAVAAWAFGFKQTFANWKTWIVIGLVAILVPTLLAAFVPFIGGFFQIALLFVYPVLYSFALLQTLSRRWKFDGVKAPAYGATLGMMVLVGVINVVIVVIALAISAIFFGDSLRNALEVLDPAQIENDPMAILPLLGSMLGMFAIASVVMFFLTPLFVFQSWYAADKAASFGTAFSEGFSAGKRNYGQLLLFYLISVLLSIAILFTLGLAVIVITPASMLAMAYAYRQVSGGPVPTDAPAGYNTQL